MTKAITVLIIIAVLYGGWEIFLYWDKVKQEEETTKKHAAAAVITSGDQLDGVPYPLQSSLREAQKGGTSGIRNWLKANDRNIRDPRKAWIQLDYVVAVAREDPAEAKRVYAEVRERTPTNSQVFPRVKQLESTYQ